MTNEFAIKVLTELRGYGDKFANIGFDRKEALEFAIKALEQTRWVPVSERLPKPQEIVIVTTKRWGHHDNDLFEDLPKYTYSTYFACYNTQFGFSDEVIAWMPLPPSYQGEENG